MKIPAADFAMQKASSEAPDIPKQQQGRNANLTDNKAREKSQDANTKGGGTDGTTSNYSVVKLQLNGLRNDEVTDDSLVTETDLNTLNTGKIMAAMADKGDLDGSKA